MITIRKELKILLAIMLLLAITNHLQAQNGSPDENPNAVQRVKMPKKTVEQKATLLTDTLNSVVSLSSDQYQKAYASNLKFVKQKEIIKKTSSGIEEAKEKVKEALKTRKSEIASILSAEQKLKWEAWKQARKGQSGKFQKGNKTTDNSTDTPIFDDIDGM